VILIANKKELQKNIAGSTLHGHPFFDKTKSAEK
jgi:hypothetical protein